MVIIDAYSVRYATMVVAKVVHVVSVQRIFYVLFWIETVSSSLQSSCCINGSVNLMRPMTATVLQIHVARALGVHSTMEVAFVLWAGPQCYNCCICHKSELFATVHCWRWYCLWCLPPHTDSWKNSLDICHLQNGQLSLKQIVFTFHKLILMIYIILERQKCVTSATLVVTMYHQTFGPNTLYV